MTPLARAAVRLYRLWLVQPTYAQRHRLHMRLHVYWAQLYPEELIWWQARTGVRRLRPWFAPREERIEWPV